MKPGSLYIKTIYIEKNNLIYSVQIYQFNIFMNVLYMSNNLTTMDQPRTYLETVK